jgi:hypothetical protein
MKKVLNYCVESSCLLVFFVCSLLIVSITNVQAKAPSQVKSSVHRQENTKMRESLVLPFAFSTDDLGAVIGVGAMATGLYQKQMIVGGTVYGGGDTKGFGFSLLDYRVLGSERFFFSAIGMMGEFPLLRAYSPLPDTYTAEPRPGSNDSSFDDFIQAEGSSNWWDVKLEYVLPWGRAEKQSMIEYRLQGGLLKEEVELESWNPLKTGTSILIARQINRYQQYRDEKGELSGAVHALELGLFYDNTDFGVNPSQGSSQYLAFTYNPQWLESKQEWTFVEVEASKYFSLGANSFAKQNIIALNAWVGYSPSWQVTTDSEGNSQVISSPPFVEGATLGGMYRMRGFRQNRFHDKAAIYATAEYRMTLDYNPIADVRWLKFLNLDWFQTVFYVEGGRVSPTFHRDTLFADWKYDAGVSLRALTAGIVVRLDFTRSKEGTSTWLMVGHPF